MKIEFFDRQDLASPANGTTTTGSGELRAGRLAMGDIDGDDDIDLPLSERFRPWVRGSQL